jgi:hypothetical protein
MILLRGDVKFIQDESRKPKPSPGLRIPTVEDCSKVPSLRGGTTRQSHRVSNDLIPSDQHIIQVYGVATISPANTTTSLRLHDPETPPRRQYQKSTERIPLPIVKLFLRGNDQFHFTFDSPPFRAKVAV